MEHQGLLTQPFLSVRSWVVFSAAQICCASGVRPALDVREAPSSQALLLEGVCSISARVPEVALPPLCHPRTVTAGQSHQRGHGDVLRLPQWLFASPLMKKDWGSLCLCSLQVQIQPEFGFVSGEVTAHREALLGLGSIPENIPCRGTVKTIMDVV